MAIHAGHRTAAIAVAEEMVTLIAEGADAAINVIRILSQHWKLQRKVILQRRAGQIRIFAQDFLGGVTLEAQLYGLILRERGQRLHADVRQAFVARLAHEVDVRASRAVAGFAVDLQCLVMRGEALRGFVPAGGDLAAVTVLAVRHVGDGAEHSMRWPVGEVGLQRDVATDRRPLQAGAQLNEPEILAADEVERQEARRAVGMTIEERLRAATHHVTTADHRIDRDVERRCAVHVHAKDGRPGGRICRNDNGVLELERLAIEAGDELNFAGTATGAPVRGAIPEVVLLLMTTRARLRADEVCERGRSKRRRRKAEHHPHARGCDEQRHAETS